MPVILVALALATNVASARAQAAPPATRPMPPTRDPHTPGYVDAQELPDGTIPSVNDEGNFIIGPTHNPAREMTVKEDVPHGTPKTDSICPARHKSLAQLTTSSAGVTPTTSSTRLSRRLAV